MQLFNIINLHL